MEHQARPATHRPIAKDEHVTELFRAYRASADRRLRNELVERHLWLARISARRFSDRGEPLDDLEQVALLGLLRAVERFSPDNGAPFTAFALITIKGELRRHFRDRTWAIHVPRPAKDLEQRIGPAIDTLSQDLRRAPRPAELAARLDASIDQVLEAMQAHAAYKTGPLGPSAFAIASVDGVADTATNRVATRAILETLPPRDRRIFELRFLHGESQQSIGRQVGLSQVQVSRILRKTLADLRRRQDEAPDTAAAS